jgi:hypothetical protein
VRCEGKGKKLGDWTDVDEVERGGDEVDEIQETAKQRKLPVIVAEVESVSPQVHHLSRAEHVRGTSGDAERERSNHREEHDIEKE